MPDATELQVLVVRWREYAAMLRRFDDAGMKGDRSERARAFEDVAHQLEDVLNAKATAPCCWRCTPDYRFMLLCPECGNKRCPRANDHDNACTGSNEPGQPGSAYA